MNRINYQKEMEKIIARQETAQTVPSLLLHSCCGPCSSACLERLTEHFEVTVYYYNPNIYPEEEYAHRVEEQERLIRQFPHHHPIHFLAGRYEPREFYEAVKGLEAEPEGGRRCTACYELRLRETARVAKEKGFDYFATTLTVSPLKDADRLNIIGVREAQRLKTEEDGKTAEPENTEGPFWLYSDFKKKNGYQRSIELSALYEMYRQDYCGCVYSLRRDFQPPTRRNC